MTSYNTDGKVGPWAEEKLGCLAKYLHAYTTILSQQGWCRGYFYIDAFAGAGRAEVRTRKGGGESRSTDLVLSLSEYAFIEDQQSQYIEGSPRIALGTNPTFTKYFFFEMAEQRVASLTAMADEFGETRDIEILHGDTRTALVELLQSKRFNWSNQRAVVFLDPFGMQVEWNVIEAIAKTKAIEVFINFPVGMAIQRLLPKSGRFSNADRAKLTRYFGSPDWETVVYSRGEDLFGETEVAKVEGSGNKLAKWYCGRLKKEFGFAAAPRLIRNSQGGHLYYLLFATPNQTGKEIANHVLSQGETVR